MSEDGTVITGRISAVDARSWRCCLYPYGSQVRRRLKLLRRNGHGPYGPPAGRGVQHDGRRRSNG
nr:MAG TPA: hypothetical protein [Caudoviricetes sp.]